MTAIFISHSSRDNAVTREVQARLLQEGYGPIFVDFDRDDGLVAGRHWWNQLSASLKQARIFLALVSEDWLASRICQEELTIARHESLPIVLLKIRECDLGSDLRQIHFIDFVQRTPEAWQRLLRALEELGASPTVFRPDPGRPLFPGLAAFDVEDAALYFGREAEITDVLARLDRLRSGAKRLFVIAGPSGAGKSSLLRAGVLARLRRRPADWILLRPFRPGLGWDLGMLRPLEETCRDWYGTLKPRGRLRELMAGETSSPESFGRFFQELAGNPEATPLIAIDQGEELLASDSGGDLEPIAQVLARLLSGHSPLLGVLSIRSDQLGALQQHAVLGPLIIDDVYSLKPMPRERYALLIDGPVAQYRRYVNPETAVEPGLRDELIATAQGADTLPLMAFVLGTLWREHGPGEGRLTLGHLARLGGVEGAVAAVAEALVVEALGSPGALDLDAVRRAFVPGLAGVTATGEIVRRRALLESLPLPAHPLLDRFVQGRLLVRDEGPGGWPQLEVAHEALLRQWPRLVEWIRQDLDALRLLEGLDRSAAAWSQAGEDPELLVHRGDVLAKSLQAVGTDLFARRFSLREQETAGLYLKAARALERESEGRRLGSGIRLAAALFEKAQREAGESRFIHAAALLGAALDANPYIQTPDEVRAACDARDLERSRSLAWRARSDLHSVLSRASFRFERRFEIERSASDRLELYPSGNALALVGRNRILDLDLRTGEFQEWGRMESGTILDFSPVDGLVLLERQKTIVLADRNGRELSSLPLPEHLSYVSTGCLLPRGRGAMVIGARGCLYFDFTLKVIRDYKDQLENHSIYSVISTKGDDVILGGTEYIQVLDVVRGECAFFATEQPYAIRCMALDPSGPRIAFGGVAKGIYLLDMKSKQISSFAAHRGSVSSLTFLGSEGLLLAISNGEALLWDLEAETPDLTLSLGDGDRLRCAASPDGHQLAILSNAGEITCWTRSERKPVVPLPHGNTIMGAAFNPAAPGELASVSFVGKLCAAIWRLEAGEWKASDLEIRSPLRSVSASPKGDVLAICGDMDLILVLSWKGRLSRSFETRDKTEAVVGHSQERLDFDLSERRDFVPNLSVSHDSRQVAWVEPSSGRISIGDIVTGEIRGFGGAGQRFSAVAFSPVEDALVVVTDEGRVLWADSREELTPLCEGASGESTFGRGAPLAFSPDGRRLAIATSDPVAITILSTANPEDRLEIQDLLRNPRARHSEAIGGLAFDPRGEFLVSVGSHQSAGDEPRAICFWSLETGFLLRRELVQGDCLAVSVDPFSETVCVGAGGRLLLIPFDRELLSKDTKAIKRRMEERLGQEAEDLL